MFGHRLVFTEMGGARGARAWLGWAPGHGLRASLMMGCAFAGITAAHAEEVGFPVYESPFNFAVLAGSTVTNVGDSVINGDLGVSPGFDITGFPPGLVNGTTHSADGVASQGQADLTIAYDVLAGKSVDALLPGDLGGLTFVAGTYHAAGPLELTGTVTLDGANDPNSIFVFQIDSTLTTASASQILLINGAQAANVYFQVGSSATLGTDTDFAGRILALTSISLNNGASILCGAALARNGAVTLINNVITICAPSQLTVGDTLGSDGTDNETAVGDAIDGVGTSDELPTGFNVLALLDADDLADALAEMSGEIATAAVPATTQAMDSFLGVVNGPHNGPGVAQASGNDSDLGDNTVSVMGYLSPPKDAVNSAFAAIDTAAARPADWQVWVSGYGGRSLVEGDADVGSQDRTIADFGIAMGAERHLDASITIGAAVSHGGTTFSLADDFGTGESSVTQGAIYARAEGGQAYVSGTLAYGVSDITTDRTLQTFSHDQLRGTFGATDTAATLEAGYHVGLFAPYAGLTAHSVTREAYTETAVLGSPMFALSYEEQKTLATEAEVGVRLDWSTPLESGRLGLHSSIALARSSSDNEGTEASFVALPDDATFTVTGAEADSPSVLVSAGMDFALDNGFSLAGTVGGRMSANATAYSGNLRLGYSW